MGNSANTDNVKTTSDTTSKDSKPGLKSTPIEKNTETSKTDKIKDKKKRKKNNNNNIDGTNIDLVFCMDCTGSMSSYINEGKKSIINIAEKIVESEKADIRFSYIAYRDHPPQDSTFITKVHPFTNNLQTMKKYIAKYGAEGGGDGPEAVTSALYEASRLKYRKNAIKFVIMIADAPMHGYGGSDDGFPNGSPSGHDPIKIAKEMAKKGIILYIVACEPGLSGFKNGHDLMAGLAKITEGKYIPLTGSHLLPDVIIGGASEEVALAKVEDFIKNEMNTLKKSNPNISDKEMNKTIQTKLNKMNLKQNKMYVDDIYGDYDDSNINMVENCLDLKSVTKNIKYIPKNNNNNNNKFNMKQKCIQSEELYDDMAVSQVMNRVSKKSSYY